MAQRPAADRGAHHLIRVLLTGFEPFGGETVNPSMPATAAVAANPPEGLAIRRLVLPVTYAGAWPALLAGLQDDPPDVVLLTGLAGGRAGLTVERVAINLDDGPMPDNAGEQRTDVPVVADGAPAYFATMPVKPMVAAARAAGVEASASTTAGTFLCNHVLYRACHHAATARLPWRCGFIHLPYLPEQATRHAGAPSLPVSAMADGLRAALDAVRRESFSGRGRETGAA